MSEMLIGSTGMSLDEFIAHLRRFSAYPTRSELLKVWGHGYEDVRIMKVPTLDDDEYFDLGSTFWTWCRENCTGKVFLISTGSFEGDYFNEYWAFSEPKDIVPWMLRWG